MVEQSFDRTLHQAILGLKKGAYLLKCGRRGKPNFHPFRLSTDEKYLIWYSGQQEKQLRLCSVKKIITGQRTENFQRQLQLDKQHQSFSLIYGANGERSLDLICKDKAQADSWFIALSAVISRCHHSKSFTVLKTQKAAQSCASSPAGYFRRKHNLGIQEDDTDISQVRSLCGSPTQSFSERCFSDALSVSSNSFSLSESSFLHMQTSVEVIGPNSLYIESNAKKSPSSYACPEFEKDASLRSMTPTYGSPNIGKTDVLKDILIWGEGVGGGNIGGVEQNIGHPNGTQFDSLIPKLLETTAMLDVESICLGAKRAALITKRGELFSWGDGSGGKLGHRANIDVKYPKVVESLDGLHIKSVACGENHTCALTDSGEMYSWGDKIYGSQWFPCKISGPLDGITILKVACGEWHTGVISALGELYTYGDGTFGALGHGDLKSIFRPKKVESFKGLWVKNVACGTWHTAAIVSGKLFTWGDGDKGRLGHIDLGKKLVPTCVSSLVGFDFVRVFCGRMFTVGLTNKGKVYTMGSSVHGQLGNPMAKDKSITLVEGKLREEFVKEISVGAYHVAALTSLGRVYTWGKGANGQLGLGSIEDRNSPTFVEALRDREVESIACGSNLTAVICLHKSISGTDQSSCSGCRMLFGLTRKKHNCYNCGLLFCHTCSSKKGVNASLAPNKSKRSRVCDLCFSNLNKDKNSGSLLKLENNGSNPRILSSNEKECSAEANPMALDIQVSNKKSPKNHGENVESASSFSGKWGQVSCPPVFESHNNAPLVEGRLSDSSVSNIDEGMLELNNMLTEEVQRLRVEAKTLETQCEVGSQKIRECQEIIEKAWSLAREEATKRKAANDIIKVLASRLQAMSEKISVGRDSKGGQNAPSISKDIINLATPRPPLVSYNEPPQVKLPKERHLDSLSSSPIVFSNTLKTMQGRGWCHDNGRLEDDSCTPKIDSREQGTKGSRHEWVEQYEPGVYITLTVLSDGQKGLKRVRFSRKRFSDKEAQKWWEENQGRVYLKYGIDGYANSSQNQANS